MKWLLAFAIVVSVCVGCSNGVKITGDSTYVMSDIQIDQKIVFSLDKITYSRSETVKYKIHNNSPNRLFFGADTSIEKNVRDKWKKLEFPDTVTPLIGIEVLAGGTFDGGVYIGQLKPGKYRLVKGISTDDEPSNDEVFLISEAFIVR